MKEKELWKSGRRTVAPPLQAIPPNLPEVHRIEVATLQEGMTANPDNAACYSTCATWPTVPTLSPARIVIGRKSF
jgi:hypothetical protein